MQRQIFVAVKASKMAVVYGENVAVKACQDMATLFSLTSRQNWWGSVVRLMSAVATRAATQ
jgi:hypothetical protein